MNSSLNPNATPFVSKISKTIILRPSKISSKVSSKISSNVSSNVSYKVPYKVPSKVPSKVSSKVPSKVPSKTRKILDQLDVLSTTVAESVLKPISHRELEIILSKQRNHFQ